MISDPVLYYTLDNADISGATVTDRGSGAHNGTLVGSPTTGSTGRIAQAITINGTSQSIDAGNVYANQTTLTLAAWVNFSSIATQARCFLNWGGSNAANLWVWNLRLASSTVGTPSAGNARIVIRAYDVGAGGSVNTSIVGSTNLTANTWYHVAVVADGSAYKIYLNGVAETLTVVAGANNGKAVGALSQSGTPKLVMGGAWYQNAYDATLYMAGLLDELRIYNRALSAGDVAELYAYAGGNSHYYNQLLRGAA